MPCTPCSSSVGGPGPWPWGEGVFGESMLWTHTAVLHAGVIYGVKQLTVVLLLVSLDCSLRSELKVGFIENIIF